MVQRAGCVGFASLAALASQGYVASASVLPIHARGNVCVCVLCVCVWVCVLRVVSVADLCSCVFVCLYARLHTSACFSDLFQFLLMPINIIRCATRVQLCVCLLCVWVWVCCVCGKCEYVRLSVGSLLVAFVCVHVSRLCVCAYASVNKFCTHNTTSNAHAHST